MDTTSGGFVNKTSPKDEQGERGIGDNGGPPLIDRNFKKRWAYSLFARQDKPAGAVAMAFKLYMEMDSQGRGATISDAEFQVSCGVSDGSCRNFKRWLISSGFVRILRRGFRGHRSEFLATIPDEIAAEYAANDLQRTTEIPAAIAGKNGAEYRQPLPARTESLPASTAAIGQNQPDPRARIVSPSGISFINNNNKLASVEYDADGPLAGLNGSADPMLQDILGWMPGGEIANARQWLSRMIQINGADVVKDSYQKLVTEVASGKPIAMPLQMWSKIATRMRQEPKAATAPTESRRERIRRVAEQTEAEIRGRRP